jgi:hypothetical protein
LAHIIKVKQKLEKEDKLQIQEKKPNIYANLCLTFK